MWRTSTRTIDILGRYPRKSLEQRNLNITSKKREYEVPDVAEVLHVVLTQNISDEGSGQLFSSLQV